MKEIFSIKTGEEQAARGGLLLMEIGDAHIFYGICDPDSYNLREASYYKTDTGDENFPEKFLRDNQLSADKYPERVISFFSKQNLLLPAGFKEPSAAYELIFGTDPSQTVYAGQVTERDILVTSAISSRLKELTLLADFKRTVINAASLLLRQEPPPGYSIMRIDFRTDEFTVCSYKEENLLVCISYEYQTADDVLYHLLRICETFSISRDDTMLEVSGLIEAESNLSILLLQYFNGMEFNKGHGELIIPEAFSAYPSHYFAVLNNLSACAS